MNRCPDSKMTDKHDDKNVFLNTFYPYFCTLFCHTRVPDGSAYTYFIYLSSASAQRYLIYISVDLN